MKIAHLFLAAVMAFGSLVSGHALADDLIHEPTGVKLPAEILGFIRGKTMDYEPTAPGQGLGVAYAKPGAFFATLFIYTSQLKPFPSSLTAPEIAKEREGAIQSLLKRAKEREPLAISANSRKTTSLTVDLPTQPKMPVLWDNFIVYLDGRATNDTLYIWLAKDHIWKLRVTRVPDHNGETAASFVKALVQLSADQ